MSSGRFVWCLVLVLLVLVCACKENREKGDMVDLTLEALEAFPKLNPKQPDAPPPEKKEEALKKAPEPKQPAEAAPPKHYAPVVLVTKQQTAPKPQQSAREALSSVFHAIRGHQERLEDQPKPLGSGLVLGGPERLVLSLDLADEAFVSYSIGPFDATLERMEGFNKAGLVLWKGSTALGNRRARLRQSPLKPGEDLIAIQAKDMPASVAVPVQVAAPSLVKNVSDFVPERLGDLVLLTIPDIQQLHGAVLVDTNGQVAGIIVPQQPTRLAAAVPATVLASLRGDLTPEKLAKGSSVDAGVQVPRGIKLGAQLIELLGQDAEKIGPDVPPVGTVSKVYPGSPAARAGLQVGDVLMNYGENRLRGMDDLVRRLNNHPQGEPLSLAVLRNGEETVVIIPDPENR